MTDTKTKLIPVVSIAGKPLTPCTCTKARKLLRDGGAIKRWSKTGIFYIQLTSQTREFTPDMSLALDPGSKWSGVDVSSEKYRQVCGMIEMPKGISDKLELRRIMRRGRRYRKTRRREARFNNRKGCKFAPSVKAKFGFEKKIVELLCKIYPIQYLALEEVSFNHYKNKWGKFFSHVEQRKNYMIEYMQNKTKYFGFKGFETAQARIEHTIKKCSSKSKISKEAHANDCLAMNSMVFGMKPQDVNTSFIYWKPNVTVKRQLHVMQTAKGNVRHKQGSTSKNGIKKGSYVFSEKFRNCWIQGFRSKNNMCYLMNSFGKRIAEQMSHRFKLLNRTNILFSINLTLY
jgi:hypothetical protein